MRATIAAAEEAQPPREVLLALAREYYALAFTPQSLGFLRTIIAASQRFPEIGSDFYAAGPRQTLDALSAWMSRQDALGNLRTGTPRLAAEHFMSLILGHVQTQGLLGIDGGLASEELDERARFCVDAFMRAFGP